jgi:plasmid stabilization system protein ParE
MTPFLLSPEAAQDIVEIYEFIAQDSRDPAERVRLELVEACAASLGCPAKDTGGTISRAIPFFSGQSALIN